MTRGPVPAIVGLLENLRAENLGRLRVLDLAAHGIEVDLDQAGLVQLGRAPDHDDILAKLQIPDQLLAPLDTERHWSRPVNRDGLPAAIASMGQGPGQAIIDQARAKADQVRALLVELARAQITGQVEHLVASMPEYRPGDLSWHKALDDLLDQLLPPDPGQDQPQTPHPETDIAPERSTSITPEMSGAGESATAGAGRVIHRYAPVSEP